MPDREKLIELLWEYDQMRMMRMSIEECVDRLAPKGLTVQEGKPLEAFLHPIDAYKGLKAKYLVFKADTGAKVDNCFILRPDKDPAAVEALRAYARNAENETLAQDIYNWVGKDESVQQWIPVTERLPEQTDPATAVLGITKKGRCHIVYYYKGVTDDRFTGFYDNALKVDVTHWMPLPEPPKGE